MGYGQDDGTVKTVVEDVSLTVHRGEVHGLIGESGSGKTQTAWSVLRLLPEGGRIVRGRIEFEGNDLASLSSSKMNAIRGLKIAYIPQEPMSNLDASLHHRQPADPADAAEARHRPQGSQAARA